MKKLAISLAIVMLLPLMFAFNSSAGVTGAESYVDDIEHHPTTIVKRDDRTYVITTNVFDGVYTRTFYKRDWGTWNIGAMSFKPNGGSEITFVAASTDWEYVFRAGKTAGSIAFCGGNHGNEKMIDMKFYNGVTGAELNLEDKKPVTVDLLKIVENTQIYFNAAPTDVFANVERIYYYNGNSIYNECNYEIVQDTYFSLSYTAMMPINKGYGSTIVYNLEDGTTREWNSKTSDTFTYKDFEGPFDRGNSALSVNIYGYNDPRYQFGVEVLTKEDSTDNFKNTSKTFYWDMSKGQNKLYFSRFPDSGSELVANGETWNTITKWDFNFVDDSTEESEVSEEVSEEVSAEESVAESSEAVSVVAESEEVSETPDTGSQGTAIFVVMAILSAASLIVIKTRKAL
ncbi:MAG: hypothetical protein PHY15_01980 [Eubacteriales bacterium]|nr:hypothetical protein [Eubacteriales bacterium]MDD4475617.1 hypothetical protein [Eubacteriales bacterium]